MKPIYALHRYFIWANRLKHDFEARLRLFAMLPPEQQQVRGTNTVEDYWIYMSYWYAALYVLVEGYNELGLSDPEIDQLLKSSNIDLLRRYRNGVCHFQATYFDERFIGITGGADAVNWVRKLHLAFARFTLNELRKV